MKYLNMGPWPGFIGLCFDEEVFRAELKRLDVRQEVKFLGHARAHASLHEFVSPKGSMVWILALDPKKRASKEMVAGLVAHEAMHIIQFMQAEFAMGKSLGSEAEAYLMQMIVQEALQTLWKSKNVRAEVPSK